MERAYCSAFAVASAFARVNPPMRRVVPLRTICVARGWPVIVPFTAITSASGTPFRARDWAARRLNAAQRATARQDRVTETPQTGPAIRYACPPPRLDFDSAGLPVNASQPFP